MNFKTKIKLVKSKKVDEIFLTLSGSEAQQAYPILERLQLAGVMVRIVPDWGNLVP